MHTIHLELVMQMRPCGQASGADVSDDLSLLHRRTVTHAFGEALHVGVEGAIAIAVLNDHGIAVTTLAPGQENLTIASTFDRRAARGRIVDAFVRADLVQNRMLAAVREA